MTLAHTVVSDSGSCSIMCLLQLLIRLWNQVTRSKQVRATARLLKIHREALLTAAKARATTEGTADLKARISRLLPRGAGCISEEQKIAAVEWSVSHILSLMNCEIYRFENDEVSEIVKGHHAVYKVSSAVFCWVNA